MADGLPAGWSVELSRRTGEPYYINSETNKSQYSRPDGASKPKVPTIKPGGKATDIIGKMFDVLDTDASGELDESEAKLFLRSTGCVEDQLDYYWKDLLRTADSDGDGSISKKEFTDYILSDETLNKDGYFREPSREADLIAQVESLAQMDIRAHKRLQEVTAEVTAATGAAKKAAEALETCGTIANQQKTRMDKLEMRLSEMHTRNMVEKANKGLPPGWLADVSRSTGEVYFVNKIKNTSQFTRPVDAADPRLKSAAGVSIDEVLDGTAEEIIGKMFDVLDTDNSGELEEAEAKLFLRSTGCVEEQLDYYWTDLRRTAHGQAEGNITKAEFVAYIMQEEQVTSDGHLKDKTREAELQEQIKTLAKMDVEAHKKLQTLSEQATAGVQKSNIRIDKIEEMNVDFATSMEKIKADVQRLLKEGTSMEMDVDTALNGTAIEMVSKMFDVVDTDSSGMLEEEEAKLFFSATGCVPDQLNYYWQDLLRTADADGDGMISKQEFLDYSLSDELIDDKGFFIEAGRAEELRQQIKTLAGMDRDAFKKLQQVTAVASTAQNAAAAAAAAAAEQKQQLADMQVSYKKGLDDMRKEMEKSIVEATSAMQKSVLAEASQMASKSAESAESKVSAIAASSDPKDEYAKWMAEQATLVSDLQQKLAEGLKEVHKASIKADDALADLEARSESKVEAAGETQAAQLAAFKAQVEGLTTRIGELKKHTIATCADTCAALEQSMLEKVATKEDLARDTGGFTGSIGELKAEQAKLVDSVAKCQAQCASVCSSLCGKLNEKLDDVVVKQGTAFKSLSANEKALVDGIAGCKAEMAEGLQEVKRVSQNVDDELATVESQVESAKDAVDACVDENARLAVRVAKLEGESPTEQAA